MFPTTPVHPTRNLSSASLTAEDMLKAQPKKVTGHKTLASQSLATQTGAIASTTEISSTESSPQSTTSTFQAHVDKSKILVVASVAASVRSLTKEASIAATSPEAHLSNLSFSHSSFNPDNNETQSVNRATSSPAIASRSATPTVTNGRTIEANDNKAVMDQIAIQNIEQNKTAADHSNATTVSAGASAAVSLNSPTKATSAVSGSASTPLINTAPATATEKMLAKKEHYSSPLIQGEKNRLSAVAMTHRKTQGRKILEAIEQELTVKGLAFSEADRNAFREEEFNKRMLRVEKSIERYEIRQQENLDIAVRRLDERFSGLLYLSRSKSSQALRNIQLTEEVLRHGLHLKAAW